MLDACTPPTAAITVAFTLDEVPLARAELVAGELLIMPQSMSILALPPIVMPDLLPRFSVAMTQYSPLGMPAAVELAMIVGAAVMNIELKGSDC